MNRINCAILNTNRAQSKKRTFMNITKNLVRLSTLLAVLTLVDCNLAAMEDSTKNITVFNADSLKDQCALFIATNPELVKKLETLPEELSAYVSKITRINEDLAERIIKIPENIEERKKQLSLIAYDILHYGRHLPLDSKIIEFFCTNYFEFKKNEKKQFNELIPARFIKKNGEQFRKHLNDLCYNDVYWLITEHYTRLIKEHPHLCNGELIPQQTRTSRFTSEQLLFLHELYDIWHNDYFNSRTFQFIDFERFKQCAPRLLASLKPAERESIKDIVEKVQSMKELP